MYDLVKRKRVTLEVGDEFEKKESSMKVIKCEDKVLRVSPYQLPTPRAGLKYSNAKSVSPSEPQPSNSLIGYVVGKLGSGCCNVTIKILDICNMRKLVVGDLTYNEMDLPENVDFVRVNKYGNYCPAHIPDIGDMSMLPKAMKVAVVWQLRKYADEFSKDLVRKEILCFVDPEPFLPIIREMTKLGAGLHKLSFCSFADAFKEYTVEENLEIISIKCRWCNLTSRWEDGRRWEVEVHIGVAKGRREWSKLYCGIVEAWPGHRSSKIITN